MLSLKAMLIKRFINICSQKRCYLNFFNFLNSLLKYAPLCSQATATKLISFLRNASMMKIKKVPNIVTILTKTIIDRYFKFGMLLWTIKYYIFPKYQCKKVTFSKVINNFRF